MSSWIYHSFKTWTVVCAIGINAGCAIAQDGQSAHREYDGDAYGQVKKRLARVNMSDFMFMRQGRDGVIRLDGYVIKFDPERPDTILRVLESKWMAKTLRIEDAEDGSPQFVIIKSWAGTPLELYTIKQGKIFLVYEEMEWDNKKYREHRRRNGELSFEWTQDNSIPYAVQFREHSDWTWHDCANPENNYYQPFEKYIYWTTRAFDLTSEEQSSVELELREKQSVESAWASFNIALGYPEAHVLLVANDYYWSPLGNQDSQYNTVFQGAESRWRFHERYKYLALEFPDGRREPIGFAGFTWFTHSDPEKPMVKQDAIFFNKVVIEDPDHSIKPYLACEPH